MTRTVESLQDEIRILHESRVYLANQQIDRFATQVAMDVITDKIGVLANKIRKQIPGWSLVSYLDYLNRPPMPKIDKKTRRIFIYPTGLVADNGKLRVYFIAYDEDEVRHAYTVTRITYSSMVRLTNLSHAPEYSTHMNTDGNRPYIVVGMKDWLPW